MTTHEQRPAQCPAPGHTTIGDLGDDLLREILVRLPSLPSLVRAALACHAFLDAFCSSSTSFRRRFLTLHPPSLLGFFLDVRRRDVPEFVPLRHSSDPDLGAVIRGADCFLTRLPDHYEQDASVDEAADSADDLEEEDSPGWKIQDSLDGYILLLDRLARQMAAYNPLSKAMVLFPQPPFEISSETFVSFRIMSSVENQGSFRVFSVHVSAEEVRAAVFSSDTGGWQVLPWPEEDSEDEDIPDCVGTTGGFVYYWGQCCSKPYLTVLNTTTLHFSRMPPDFGNTRMYQPEPGPPVILAGETKDGKLCIVAVIRTVFCVWFWRADDSGLDSWVKDNRLNRVRNVEVLATIGGCVYLYKKRNYKLREAPCFVSFSLETGEFDKLMSYEGREDHAAPAPSVFLYCMTWPSSLIPP